MRHVEIAAAILEKWNHEEPGIDSEERCAAAAELEDRFDEDSAGTMDCFDEDSASRIRGCFEEGSAAGIESCLGKEPFGPGHTDGVLLTNADFQGCITSRY
jgi:hypothetical protein